jgi:hypothetical protein
MQIWDSGCWYFRTGRKDSCFLWSGSRGLEVSFLEDTEVEGGQSSQGETETDSDRETERTLGLLGLEKLCEHFVKELRTLRKKILGKRGMLIF